MTRESKFFTASVAILALGVCIQQGRENRFKTIQVERIEVLSPNGEVMGILSAGEILGRLRIQGPSQDEGNRATEIGPGRIVLFGQKTVCIDLGVRDDSGYIVLPSSSGLPACTIEVDSHGQGEFTAVDREGNGKLLGSTGIKSASFSVERGRKDR